MAYALSMHTTVTPSSLQQKNEMLKARITTAENMTLTLESIQTICEQMFSDRMLQIERKIQLMFEKLLKKQGSTADVPDPATETPSELATVENGLVVLQAKYHSKEKTEAHRAADTSITYNRSEYSSIHSNGDGQRK
jgi:hypothetical protein